MRSRYKVLNPLRSHFVTSTIVEWMPVFTRNKTCDILPITRIRQPDKDRMHLRDLAVVNLIDNSWLPRFSSTLSIRLQDILHNPQG